MKSGSSFKPAAKNVARRASPVDFAASVRCTMY